MGNNIFRLLDSWFKTNIDGSSLMSPSKDVHTYGKAIDEFAGQTGAIYKETRQIPSLFAFSLLFAAYPPQEGGISLRELIKQRREPRSVTLRETIAQREESESNITLSTVIRQREESKENSFLSEIHRRLDRLSNDNSLANAIDFNSRRRSMVSDAINLDCECDFHNDICELSTRKADKKNLCLCDPDCNDAEPCQEDNHCDSWCKVDTDPDCEESTVVSTRDLFNPLSPFYIRPDEENRDGPLLQMRGSENLSTPPLPLPDVRDAMRDGRDWLGVDRTPLSSMKTWLHE